MKVVVIGGGWAGCAAALSACNQGAECVLVERTDMLLGTGLVGGIMRNNGRWTATEEMIAMGGDELFALTDRYAVHRNIEFPHHKHASIYNTIAIEPAVRMLLRQKGIQLMFCARFTDVKRQKDRISAAVVRHGDDSLLIEGDAFVDATGTAGPMANCAKFGNGCVMCVLRCPSFGGRVSVAGQAGIKESVTSIGDKAGAMSGSCKLMKESLTAKLQDELNKSGVVGVKVTDELAQRIAEELPFKACQQYALPEFIKTLFLLDTGKAKMMSPFVPLELLRQIPGMENARYEDPYAGGKGNSMRFLAMSPRDNSLKVTGIDNLFCAGEKIGPCVGHTEAIVSGCLAGYNAVKFANGESLLQLPVELACGDYISYTGKAAKTPEGLSHKYTFSGSAYFDRMKELGLYITEQAEIKNKVMRAGLTGLFAEKSKPAR
jgi:hypothetical protein